MLHVRPIINRELLAFLRKLQAFATLFIYLLILGGLAFYGFAYASWGPGVGSLAADRTMISRLFFLNSGYIQIPLFALLATSLSARQISSERAARTFDLLRTSPLRDSEIILGKVLSSVGFLMLLAVASVPFYSICLLMGGIGWHEIAILVYLVLLTTFTYALIGVMASSRPNLKQGQDRSGGIWWLILLNGGVYVIIGVTGTALNIRSDALRDVAVGSIFLTSPVAAFVGMTSSGWLGAFVDPSLYLLVFTAFQLFLIAYFFWRTARNLRKQPVVPVGGRHDDTRSRKRPAPKRGLRDSLAFFPIPGWLNPVAAKDFLLSIPRKRWSQALIALLWVMILLACGALVVESRTVIGRSADGVYRVAALLTAIIACVAIYFRASAGFSSEIEANTSSLLSIVPLQASKIAWGKAIAATLSAGGVIAAIVLPLGVLFCFLHRRAIPSAVVTTLLAASAIAVSGLMYGSLGVWVSATGRSPRATGNRALFVLAMAIGITLLLAYAIGMFLDHAAYTVLGMRRAILGAFAIQSVGTFLLETLYTLVFPARWVLAPVNGEYADQRYVFFLLGIAIHLSLATLFVGRAARAFQLTMVREDRRKARS